MIPGIRCASANVSGLNTMSFSRSSVLRKDNLHYSHCSQDGKQKRVEDEGPVHQTRKVQPVKRRRTWDRSYHGQYEGRAAHLALERVYVTLFGECSRSTWHRCEYEQRGQLSLKVAQRSHPEMGCCRLGGTTRLAPVEGTEACIRH